MRRRQDPLLERIAAIDPARGAQPSTVDRDELWARITASTAPAKPTDRRKHRRSRRTGVLVLLAALAATTGALAATKVIPLGAPGKPTRAFSNPHRGAGAVLPHSVRLLAVRAPDPDGGPAWGMRLFSTTRGVGCVQVARVLDGKLGAIGRDHAFGDDGRFHPLPVSSVPGAPNCTALDAAGHIFLNVHVDYMPASAIRSCGPPGFIQGGPPPQPICNPASQRTLQFGFLGPDATSVTYTVGGHARTQPTIGPEGAYLIVTRAKQQHRSDAISGGPLPFGGPITAIEYRDGSRCHLPAHGAAYPRSACQPHGYAAPSPKLPTRREIAAPIHVRVRRSRNPHRRAILEISFIARAPISSARNAYWVTWSGSNERRTIHVEMTQGDVRRGQIIRKRFAVTHPGRYRGEVRFLTSTGPYSAPLPGLHQGALVGRWTVTVH